MSTHDFVRLGIRVCMHSLARHFAAIGARLEVRHTPDIDFAFDVIRTRRDEYFELRGSRPEDLSPGLVGADTSQRQPDRCARQHSIIAW